MDWNHALSSQKMAKKSREDERPKAMLASAAPSGR